MPEECKIMVLMLSIIFPLFLGVVRIFQVLPSLQKPSTKLESVFPEKFKGSTIMILLGSGGHTGEMVSMLDKVDLSNFKRIWVVSSGDTTSLVKGKEFEDNHLKDSLFEANYLNLPRARKVGESIMSSIKSTIFSFIKTFIQLISLKEMPKILLINGPGTCIPLAYSLFILKYFGLCSTRIIYVESLARVNKLSVSGKLVLPISDRFLVQWEELSFQYRRAEYKGILV